MFADHRDRFTTLASAIATTAAENERLASASLDRVQERLATVVGAAAVAGPAHRDGGEALRR